MRSNISTMLFDFRVIDQAGSLKDDVADADVLLVHDTGDTLANVLDRRLKQDWTTPICGYAGDIQIRRAVIAIRRGATDYFKLAGETCLTERLVYACLKGRDEHVAWARPIKFKAGVPFLSPRERQVAKLIAQGVSFHDIAKELGISKKTVGNMASNAYARLGINRRYDLIAMQRFLE